MLASLKAEDLLFPMKRLIRYQGGACSFFYRMFRLKCWDKIWKSQIDETLFSVNLKVQDVFCCYATFNPHFVLRFFFIFCRIFRPNTPSNSVMTSCKWFSIAENGFWKPKLDSARSRKYKKYSKTFFLVLRFKTMVE